MQRVKFFNKQNEMLSGLLFSSSKKQLPGIIICHGFTSSKYSKINIAKSLSKKFTVLIFDAAGSGESQGRFEDHTVTKYLSDLECAVDFMKKQKCVLHDRIGIAGTSLGGFMSILYAVTHKDVKAIIPVCAPFNLTKIKGKKSALPESIIKRWKELGYMQFEVRVNEQKIKKNLSYSFIKDAQKYDLSKMIKKIKCPVIFVHGDADENVPIEHANILFKNAPLKKEMVVVKGADHFFKGKDEKTLEKILFHGFEKLL